jgi:N-dimethylarginine dimethylaminohydrolase
VRVYVDSEQSPLREVLLGYADNVRLHPTPLNSIQEYYFSSDPPRVDLIARQHEEFVETLDRRGVRIHRPKRQLQAVNQIFVRDLLAVIHDRAVVCSLKENLRSPEITALDELIAQFHSPPLLVQEGTLEGGDVMIDGTTLFIGISTRTSLSAMHWLEEQFGGEVQVIPMFLKPPFLHLDVVLNLPGKGTVMLYPPAFEEWSLEVLRKRYRLLEVTAEEQFASGTNILFLTTESVISQKRMTRINDLLRKEGFEVVELEYSELCKFGGSFRCSACPLVREHS